MTRTELIVQLLKVAIGLAFGAYFRLVEFASTRSINPSIRCPDRCGRPRIMRDRRRASREPMAWTLAFEQPEDRTPTHWLRGDARGRDGGIREELAAGMGE
jgi:hypothetical protein